MFELWPENIEFKCVKCQKKLTTLSNISSSKTIVCAECGTDFYMNRNFIDFSDSISKPREQSKRYADLFSKLESKDPNMEFYYSKTIEQEVEEFFDETKTNPDDLVGLKILDAGCGVARLSRELSERGAYCIAMDLHPLLDDYSTNHQNGKKFSSNSSPLYVKAGIENIPFNDSFDIVWCQGVLSYVDDPASAIKELSRVVTPGGKIYLTAVHSKKTRILYSLGRMIRNMPFILREPMYDIVGATYDCLGKLKRFFLGRKTKSLRQTWMHLRDFSTADDIKLVSTSILLNNFDRDEWEIISHEENDTAVFLMAKKKITS